MEGPAGGAGRWRRTETMATGASKPYNVFLVPWCGAKGAELALVERARIWESSILMTNPKARDRSSFYK